MFSKFSEDLPDSFHVTLASVFAINLDIIEIQDDENIKFFYWDFVNIALEAGRRIGKTKKYDLVLKMAVLYLESFFLFVIFLNSHLMICVH